MRILHLLRKRHKPPRAVHPQGVIPGPDGLKPNTSPPQLTAIDAEEPVDHNPHIQSLAAALNMECRWRLENLKPEGVGGFATLCGLVYFFGAHPKDNGYNFCPNCGKNIKYLSPAIDLKTGDKLPGAPEMSEIEPEPEPKNTESGGAE